MNKDLLNKLLAIDDKFSYKLTIVTSNKFSFKHNNLNKNKELLDRYAKVYLIKELSKLTRKTLEKKDFKLLNKIELEQMEEHFYCITSFEAIKPELNDLSKQKDRYIHFHYVFSKAISFNYPQNKELTNKLEKEILTDYKAKLDRLKKDGKIKSFELKPYIPHKDFIKEHPDSASFISYTLKEADNSIYPVPFYSKALIRDTLLY